MSDSIPPLFKPAGARVHLLCGFGGGPNDIPACAVCGEVLPEADAECPGPKADRSVALDPSEVA